jgi:hypothetical protein
MMPRSLAPRPPPLPKIESVPPPRETPTEIKAMSFPLGEDGSVTVHGSEVYVRLPAGHTLRVLAPELHRVAIFPMIPKGQSKTREAVVKVELEQVSTADFEAVQLPDATVWRKYVERQARPWWKVWG